MTNDQLIKQARKYASSLAEGAQKNLAVAAYMDGARMMAAYMSSYTCFNLDCPKRKPINTDQPTNT